MTATTLIEYVFRAIIYGMGGLVMEMIFSTHGIEICLQLSEPLRRRVPKKYLEGFVSAYMIPLHSLGILFLCEPTYDLIRDLPILIRYGAWAALLTGMEIFWGIFLHKTIGFYPWDYYKLSKFKVFKEGYTLWTLIPCWGIAGLALEPIINLMRYLSPWVSRYFF